MIEREKKMNKKITAVFLVMCVLASAVAGCKNADAAVETTEATASSAVESTAESEAAAASETEAEEPVETEATEATEATTEATTAQTTAPKVEPKEPKLELDGNKKTKITVKENSYYEGDRFVLYFQEGAKIKGDIAKTVERVMKEDEDVIGLSFDNYSHCTESTWRVDCFGGGGAFFGINEDMSKVNILIMKNPDNGTIEWAMPDCVYLFDTTFDRKYKDGGHDTLFHELAHALRLRNSVNLGDIFEEGVALYAQDRVSRKEKYADWSIIQYVDYGYYHSQYNDKPLKKDPEKCFIKDNTASRSAGQLQYQYGIRFVFFLFDTYGKDVIKNITEVANKYQFSGTDSEKVVEIIKEATSKDVFKKFKKWLPGGWKKFCKGYVRYVEKSVK